MPTENAQENTSIDDLRAALGFSNNILSQMLPQDEPQVLAEAPTEAPEPLGGELEPETTEEPPIDPEALKQEILASLKAELPALIRETLKGDREKAKKEVEEGQK